MTATPPATIDRHTGYPAAHSRQQATVLEGSMIKDVMVHLDGTYSDEVRLAAAVDLAEKFDSHIIGLLLVVIPAIAPADPHGALAIINLREAARKEGDDAEARLRERLSQLKPGSELRRIGLALVLRLRSATTASLVTLFAVYLAADGFLAILTAEHAAKHARR
jgi:hypothetical protein